MERYVCVLSILMILDSNYNFTQLYATVLFISNLAESCMSLGLALLHLKA